jgi:hypothetical protein
MTKMLGVVMIILGLSIGIGGTIYEISVSITANQQYNIAFGSDVTMTTSGATTLTGPDSIQDYLTRIWTNMNNTFDMRNAATTYGAKWPWEQIPENSLAKQNSYFNSLNNSLTTRQKAVDSAIQNGNYLVDPLQNAINQTRNEMKAYGGLDWALRSAWYLKYYPSALWCFEYTLIMLAVAAFLVFSGYIILGSD